MKLGAHTHHLTPHLKGETMAGVSLGTVSCAALGEDDVRKVTLVLLPLQSFQMQIFFLLNHMLELLHWTCGFPRRLSSACDPVCSQGAAGASSWATLESIAETKVCRLIPWHLGG